MSAWQPIESAPRDNSQIIVAQPLGYPGHWTASTMRLIPGDYDFRPGSVWATLPTPSVENGLSGRTGSNANTAEGNQATDTISPLPQPSDATELVERSQAIVTGLSRSPGYAGSIEAACCWIEQAADFITQAQARATAAEGERDEAIADRDEWKDAANEAMQRWTDDYAKVEAAQQTITQLTRELETARKVLEPLVNTPLPKARQFDDPIEVLELWAACRIEIRKALSSLSHQDEQG